MNPTPLVSIIIPAFNPRFFKEAIQSALNQSWENLEIIICDDCSGDGISSIVEELPVPESVSLRYLRNSSTLGFAQNLLHGVAQAQGELIKILCDDDRLFRDSISLQAHVLLEFADVNLVMAPRFLIDAESKLLPARLINAPLVAHDTLLKGGDILALINTISVNFLGNLSSSLMRTADVKILLPALFQEGAGFSALLDFALFICLLRRGNMVMLHSALSVERLYPERLSKQPGMMKAATVETAWLKEMLAVRGGENAPAAGWVRAVEIVNVIQGREHEWYEMGLQQTLSNLQNSIISGVGDNSQSYTEFFADWLRVRCLSETEKRLLPDRVSTWPSTPRIGIVVHDPFTDTHGLQITLQSLQAQLYEPHAVIVLSDALPEDESGYWLSRQVDWVSQFEEIRHSESDVDWWYLLQSGDRLVESALIVMAERVAHYPDVLCIYSDECALVDGVALDPVFKPDFNLDLMRSYPYIGRTLAFSNKALENFGGLNPLLGLLAPHDLVWRVVETCGLQAVEHIAEVQHASSFSFAQWLSLPEMMAANRKLLCAHLDRLGIAHAVRAGDFPLVNRVDYLHGQQDMVSIIIRAGERLSVLQRCIETLIEHTVGVRYEILVITGARQQSDINGWLEDVEQFNAELLRVVRLDDGNDNEALLKNHASLHSRGEYLLFLSAYTVFTDSQWLVELLNHARRAEVGVVGGRILHPQGAIYSAGIIIGLNGLASSPFAGEAADASGYMQRLRVAQNWSAVSGDCMMVPKQTFQSVGGFDSQYFELGYYDVDLCLRIAKEGYLVVSTPYSEVVLAKSLVLKSEPLQPEKLEREREVFSLRWISKITQDPAYNPNLSLSTSAFSLHAGLKEGWDPFCARTSPCILALPINSSGTGHYRVLQPLHELKSEGRVVGQVMYGSPSLVSILRMNPDVIIFQCRYTKNSPAYIESIKKYSGALRVFELDDYVVETTSKNTHARNKAVDIEAIVSKSIALCDRVVVTTEALKRALSGMHRDIRVVPNMLAPHLWTHLKTLRRTSTRPRVGWGGGTSHTGDLEVIADVVRELANEVEWVFFGMCPEALRPYVHEFHPVVGLHAYPEKLASLNLDLALAPLEFHIFNDCKSNLRLLEYGACGYPVVCSDTEAYRGRLPCTRVKSNSTVEWLEAIRTHLADPEASYRMGDELRQAVLQDFMLAGDNLQLWEWGWLPDR